MRNCIRAAAVSLVLGLASVAGAQGMQVVEAGPQNIIDVNPALLLRGRLSLEYERSIGPAISFLVGPQVVLFSPIVFPQSGVTPGVTPHGIGLVGALHFFPMAHALAGFWIGPEVNVLWQTASLNSTTTTSGPEFHVDGILGYTFVPAEHFIISIGIGAGYIINGVASSDSSLVVSKQGFDVTGRFALGYAF